MPFNDEWSLTSQLTLPPSRVSDRANCKQLLLTTALPINLLTSINDGGTIQISHNRQPQHIHYSIITTDELAS